MSDALERERDELKEIVWPAMHSAAETKSHEAEMVYTAFAATHLLLDIAASLRVIARSQANPDSAESEK